KTLTPDAKRATIAVLSLVVVLLVPGALAQVAAMVAAGFAGFFWLRTPIMSEEPASAQSLAPALAPSSTFTVRVPRALAVACLGAYAALLAAVLTVLPVLAHATGSLALTLFTVFARAGSLVFGGGHVVLPLLEADTVQAGLV